MESNGYEPRDRSLVGILATLTHGVLSRPDATDESVTAHTAPTHRSLLDRLDNGSPIRSSRAAKPFWRKRSTSSISSSAYAGSSAGTKPACTQHSRQGYSRARQAGGVSAAIADS
jgi:hypothetical protein